MKLNKIDILLQKDIELTVRLTKLLNIASFKVYCIRASKPKHNNSARDYNHVSMCMGVVFSNSGKIKSIRST